MESPACAEGVLPIAKRGMAGINRGHILLEYNISRRLIGQDCGNWTFELLHNNGAKGEHEASRTEVTNSM